MTGEKFFVDAIITKSILGCKLGDPYEKVARLLGDDFVDELYGEVLRQDYGLIEFAYATDEPRPCKGISIQVHRLARFGASVVPDAVARRYGVIDRYLGMSSLLLGLKAHGFDVLHGIERNSAGFHEYLLAKGVAVYSVADKTKVREKEPGVGDVWTISLFEGLNS
jgi:hypothetical protein